MNKLVYLFSGALLLSAGCSSDNTGEAELGTEPLRFSVSSESSYVETADDGKTYDVEFGAVGGEAVFTVESSTRVWELNRPDAGWLTIEESYDTFTVAAGLNDESSPYETSFTVTAGSGNDTQSVTINVKQRTKGGSELGVNPADVVLTAGGQYPQTVEIETDNEIVSIHTSCSWLLVEQEDNKLILTPDPNPETEPRSTSILVSLKADDGTENEEIINVTQEAKAYIEFSQSGFSYYSTDSGDETVTVSTNQEGWSVELQQFDWVTLSSSGDTIGFSIGPNDGNDIRTAAIAVTAGKLDNIVTEYLTITQVGSNPAEMVFELQIPENSKPACLGLYGDMDCTVNWGDGTVETITGTDNPLHQYKDAGKYYPVVSGNVPALTMNSAADGEILGYIKAVKRWGQTGLASMENAFLNCEKLTEIPGDTDGSFKDVITFKQAFKYCIGIEKIPADLFRYAGEATDFESVFFNYYFYDPQISEIPKGLLDYCVKAQNMRDAFSGLILVKEAPADLFHKCPEITDFTFVFYQTGLETIPEGLFDKNTKVEEFTAAFGYTPIKSIPAGLFRYNVAAWNMISIFTYCEQLASIPSGLFDYNVEAYNFYNIFSHCTALEEIPAGLFDKNTKCTEFRNTFFACTSITAIPEDLFKNNREATNYFGAFQSCTSLKDVPATLFAEDTEATNMQRFFYGCTALEEVPAGIFDNCKKVTNFSYTFYGCTALSGASPYTNVNGTNIRLWERSSDNGFAAVTSTVSCFRSCTNLTDYDEIPDGWK